eukprot:CFRG0167T1
MNFINSKSSSVERDYTTSTGSSSESNVENSHTSSNESTILLILLFGCFIFSLLTGAIVLHLVRNRNHRLCSDESVKCKCQQAHKRFERNGKSSGHEIEISKTADDGELLPIVVFNELYALPSPGHNVYNAFFSRNYLH